MLSHHVLLGDGHLDGHESLQTRLVETGEHSFEEALPVGHLEEQEDISPLDENVGETWTVHAGVEKGQTVHLGGF